jgi:nickel/cobalt transporter (NicO) family protein
LTQSIHAQFYPFTMNITAVTTLAALSLGAVHALEPGHGKTFITSYLLTGRSSKRQLMIMGFSMALSHTLILMLLGALIFFFSSQVADTVTDFILFGSPLLVTGIGAFMVYRFHQKKAHSGCSCKHHNTHKHDHQHVHEKITTRAAAMVGFTGGLLPCPSAIAVFSLSGTTADPKSAFCMMLLYIAGFIVVMSGLILGASFIKNKVVSSYFSEKKNQLIQKFSAYAILLTGIMYLVHNVYEHM